MSELSFVQLKKLSRKQSEREFDVSAVLLGNCATQHLADAIRGYGIKESLNINLLDTDYNQIDAQVLDENSELYAHNPQFVIIYLSAEKLVQEFVGFREKNKFADDLYARIGSYWDTISNRIKTTILQFNFVEIDDKVFGNYATKVDSSFLFQIRKLNYLLSTGIQNHKNVYTVDLNSIQSEFGRKKTYDPKLYYIGKLPLALDVLPIVAKSVIDVFKSVKGSIKKCIICDLDNTLWGGVIGDDGIEGIQIGELGLGHAFEDLQYWIKSLKERGILICICSKNNESTAKEPFEKHPDMVLKLDDITMFVANWKDKASNILDIQKTLNIGMDSIVFLDDNPFERDQVKSMIPEITVPDLPEDPALYLDYLKSLNLFETASYSVADKERSSQYQAEAKRVKLESTFKSYDEYLDNLGMTAEVKAFDEFNVPRIAQLTQRSNQFNLRTVRCTEDDVKNLVQNKDYITRYFTLKDKFGDYGLISVLIMKKQSEDTLFIQNWLMSCRVLKRGMEEFISNHIISIAKENGYKYVIGEYIPTLKNGMVKELYLNLGFSKKDANLYVADVDNWHEHKTYIREGEVV